MAENGRKWQKMVEKWSKMDFRGKMVGNGFPRVLRHGSRGGQVGNGRKWSKMDFRGKMVGNGFPRVVRHFPTTCLCFEECKKRNEELNMKD